MIYIFYTIALLIINFRIIQSEYGYDLNVVVLSHDLPTQRKTYHEFERNLVEEAKQINKKVLVSCACTQWSKLPGWWAIWPILPRFTNHMRQSRWTIFCDIQTEFRLEALILFLINNFSDPLKNLHFIGKSLYDVRPVIIHHYDQLDEPFPYPDIALGVIFSRKLINTLISDIEKHHRDSFTIDANYELAKFVYKITKVTLNQNGSLSDGEINRRFCTRNNSTVGNLVTDGCITVYRAPEFVLSPFVECSNNNTKQSRKLLTDKDAFYAVKTFSGFHKSRVVVVKRTWLKDLWYAILFSNQEDQYLSTIVNLGIPNTKKGHCLKTFGIMEYFLNFNDNKNLKWLVIADDDTLLGVTRLNRLLSCLPYNQALIVGQRYGYGFRATKNDEFGYDYPTGGAGMIFTHMAVERMVRACSCPSADSPDDMIIGMCARQLNIPIIDAPGLHQTQPLDYSAALLERQQPLMSFHKFENVDPYDIYVSMLFEKEYTQNHEEL